MMRKATTMPTTAREVAQRLEPLPLHRRLRVVGIQRAMDTPRPADALPLARACAPPRRAITLSAPSTSNGDLLRPSEDEYAGWLAVEHDCKRTFVWRFCVLDGAKLTCYDSDLPNAQVAAEIMIADVERLHCINRALVLVDTFGYRLWVHADHSTDNFERWLQLFTSAVDRRASFLQLPAVKRQLESSLDGWVLLERTRFGVPWLWRRQRRMYCVLTDRQFSAFAVNREGRWSDFSGELVSFRADDKLQWIELRFARMRTRARLSAVKVEATQQWLERLQNTLVPML